MVEGCLFEISSEYSAGVLLKIYNHVYNAVGSEISSKDQKIHVLTAFSLFDP